MSEASEQREFVTWFRTRYPQYALSLRVSQSGAYRGSGTKGAIRTSQARLQGAVKGEADIAILVPRGTFGCLLVEHKKAGGRHQVTTEQQEYLDYHNRLGNCAVSTQGLGALQAAVTAYLVDSEWTTATS